jgi:hypothetical protein
MAREVDMKTMLRFMVPVLFAASGSAFALERAHLVQPEDLPKWWVVSAAGDANVLSYGKNLTAPTCAAVSYRINRDGTVSNAKLEKIVPDGDLAKVAVDTFRSLQYVAAEQNIGKDPVYTYQILLFNTPSDPKQFAEKQRIYNQCKLEDFKQPATP